MSSRFYRTSSASGMSRVLNFRSPSLAAFHPIVQFPSHYSTASSASPAVLPRHEIKEDMSMNTEVVGDSGCRYLIQRILQEKGPPMGRVYLATAGKKSFVLKEVSQSDFDYYLDMYRGLGSCAYLRLLHDTIPERFIFVYKYFTDHLLHLTQKDLPIALTKRILKDTLRGLAVLHDHNIVHSDVKANNIVINWEKKQDEILVTEVQLTDIEDSAYVTPGYSIRGKQVGNWMWRSPEAHTRGRVNTPSDMFSFGVVCIYAVLKRLIFYVTEEEIAEGEELLAHVLERQISYFANEDGLNGLLNYLGDSPWCQVLEVIRDGFNEAEPRKPFSMWKNVDAEFKDLIGGLMNFDPTKRLTAHEALAHRWFKGF